MNIDEIIAKADEAGYDAGKSAGSWVIDGNTSSDTAARLLQGLEDGDPEVYDSLPGSPLSGEWADGLLPRDVLGWYDMNEDDPAAGDVLDAFELGYSRGVEDEVSKSAKAIL